MGVRISYKIWNDIIIAISLKKIRSSCKLAEYFLCVDKCDDQMIRESLTCGRITEILKSINDSVILDD